MANDGYNHLRESADEQARLDRLDGKEPYRHNLSVPVLPADSDAAPPRAMQLSTIRTQLRKIKKLCEMIEEDLTPQGTEQIIHIDDRDDAYTLSRMILEKAKPLENMIGNLPGIDPWDPSA